MGQLAVTTLLFVTGLVMTWSVGHSIREGRIGKRSWTEHPVRFVFGASTYAASAVLVLYVSAVGAKDVELVLWSLWAGALGPVVAWWLSRRHWGDIAARELVDALSRLRAQGDLDRASQLLLHRTREGAARRCLAAALREPLPALAPTVGYRDAERPPFSQAQESLAAALAAERRRGLVHLLPALLPPLTCTLLWVAPPIVDAQGALSVAALEVVLAGWVLVRVQRRARRVGESIRPLSAALRGS